MGVRGGLEPGLQIVAFRFQRLARGVGPIYLRREGLLVPLLRGQGFFVDRLELARNLQMEMRLHKVAPTLATHNAFICVCASRAAALAELPLDQHQKLRRLNVDIDVASPIRMANSQLQTLLGEGHAPDEHTYLALLRVAAGAADVPRAQSTLTRLLDSAVAPSEAHFHTLLRACYVGPLEGAAPLDALDESEDDASDSGSSEASVR